MVVSLRIKLLLLVVMLSGFARGASLRGTVVATDGKPVQASVYLYDVGTVRVKGTTHPKEQAAQRTPTGRENGAVSD